MNAEMWLGFRFIAVMFLEACIKANNKANAWVICNTTETCVTIINA